MQPLPILFGVSIHHWSCVGKVMQQCILVEQGVADLTTGNYIQYLLVTKHGPNSSTVG